MKNRYIILTTILLALGYFALPQRAQAVSPAPDGGYPGGNTAEGQNALLSLTSGAYNTGVGVFSLESNTGGKFNTGVGAGTLLANTGDNNTATGAGALLSNTASSNTANGAFALFSNTSGGNNTALGEVALYSNTIGGPNTAVGVQALYYNISGNFNTASGYDALVFNNGDNNTAYGVDALDSNTSGSNNTALGREAGGSLTIGDNNIDIGYNVVGVAGESNTIRIGNTDITDTFIRGISGTAVTSGATVLVASNGHLGTLISSKRFKEEIKPMDKTSEALFSLKPVTFHYKKELDPARTQQFGLVAEDVEKVNPDLVVRDEHGKVNSVRYEQVNAMLLNEFLKEHRQVQEQHATIVQLKANAAKQDATVAQLKSTVAKQETAAAHQQEQIEALTAGLQKVSAQVEMSRAAPQVVDNRQ
jgi:uncharacterized coiled-coil protein SlyX